MERIASIRQKRGAGGGGELGAGLDGESVGT